MKRALKVLADREVTPQLGVLKSTLLQLDSTFSEREYGVEHLPRLRAEARARRWRRRSRAPTAACWWNCATPARPRPAERETDATSARWRRTGGRGEAPSRDARRPPADATLDMPGGEPPPADGTPAQQAEGYAIIKDVF